MTRHPERIGVCAKHGKYWGWCGPCVDEKLQSLPPHLERFIRDMDIKKPN